MKAAILVSRNIELRYRFPQFILPLKRKGIETDIYRLRSYLPGFFEDTKPTQEGRHRRNIEETPFTVAAYIDQEMFPKAH